MTHHDLATHCLQSTLDCLQHRIGMPKDIVMQVMAQGLAVMLTNPDGSDRMDEVIEIMRAVSTQTAEYYRTHPDEQET